MANAKHFPIYSCMSNNRARAVEILSSPFLAIKLKVINEQALRGSKIIFTITARSISRTGTTFTKYRIEHVEKTMKKHASSVESDTRPEMPFYILIVDDDVENLRLLKDILCIKFPSVKIHTAYNGAQALELLDDLNKKGLNIDFVLTDYEMPIMNGAELCKSIKKAHPNVKNAIMTGFLLPKDENVLYFDEIMYKPIDISVLFKSISAQMKIKGSTGLSLERMSKEKG